MFKASIVRIQSITEKNTVLSETVKVFDAAQTNASVSDSVMQGRSRIVQ